MTKTTKEIKPEVKCKNFDKYLAIWRPKCNCLACRDKFINKLVDSLKCP